MSETIVWSAWLGGLAVGIYGLAQFAVFGQQLGVSAGFGNLCGFLSREPYFHAGPYERLNNWRLWFVIGIPLGGALAALSSPAPLDVSFSMGAFYESIMPETGWAKALVLFAGGILLGLGARMAGGCTSGHGIFGCALLNRPSLLATGLFLAGGVLSAQLVFRLLT